MNDLNRNTRTLIVSFVVVIMTLVPLRFIEVGGYLGQAPVVLGEETGLNQRVYLPNAELTGDSLEMPYSEIEAAGEVAGVRSSCLNEADVANASGYVEEQLAKTEISEEEIGQLVGQLQVLEEMRCR